MIVSLCITLRSDNVAFSSVSTNVAPLAHLPTRESLASARQGRVARAIAGSPAKKRYLCDRLRFARYAFKDLAESLD